MILFISLAMHITYLLCLTILCAHFTSTYRILIFTLYNACTFCDCKNSGWFLFESNFTLFLWKSDYRTFFSRARACLWKYSQFTHSPSFFLLCRCNIEDIFHGWGAHRIRYLASMSFHGDGGYNFHLLIIQENQR